MTMLMPTADPLLEAAEEALEAGRPLDALELCRQLLGVHPDHIGAIFLEAEVYRELRDAEGAEARFRRVIELDTDHADAWSGLGTVLFDQCRFDESSTCFARTLRADPGHPDALYGRAMLRERRGDAAGSRRDYLRAWQNSPRYPLPHALDDGAVKALVRDAAATADETVGAFVMGAPVIVLDVPEPMTCEAYEPRASPGELLGHFTGTMMPIDSMMGSHTALPPALIMYRRNLERFAGQRDHLVVAVRESVLVQVAEWLERSTVSE